MSTLGSAAPRRWPSEHRLEHRSIIVVDIVDSARWHNRAHLHARNVLATAVHAAVHTAGISRTGLAIEDRGDGMILLVPAHVSKIDLLDPAIPRLVEQIHAHNTATEPTLRIQLRVAVHAGEVHRHAHGWVGTDLITACRLVNGAPLYQQLENPPQPDVALVVSDLIYQGVVRHHYRNIDPATYTPVHIQVKETSTLAWLHTPISQPPKHPDPIDHHAVRHEHQRDHHREPTNGHDLETAARRRPDAP